MLASFAVSPKCATAAARRGVTRGAVGGRDRRRCFWLALLLAIGCRRTPEPVWERAQPVPGLVTTPLLVDTAPAPDLSLIHVRPVLAQPRTLLQQHLAITASGRTVLPLAHSDESWLDINTADARLVDSRGGARVLTARIRSNEKNLSTVLQFEPADVGAAFDLTVTAALPFPPLRAESAEFVVPRDAHLRFGTALRDAAENGPQAHVRVVLRRATGAEAVLLDAALPERRSSATPRSTPPGWHDVDVDLSSHGGEPVRLIFDSTRDTPADGAWSPLPLPLISEPLLVVPAPRQQRRNLIVVSIDTLRADHTGVYGYTRPTTPLIDGLARQGAVIEQAFAAWPETSASHMTLFTSLYPSVHGVALTRWGLRSLPAWQLTLAEVLGQHGYVAAGITEDGLVAHQAGFARGFADYGEFRRPGRIMSAAAVAERVFGAGAEWLQQHRDDRFFLFLHTYQVHERVAAGPPYDALRERFAHDGTPAVSEHGATMMRDYDVAVRFADDALGQLTRALDGLHLTENTLLVITSDHGEEFGTHMAYGHGGDLFDFALRVPLVLWSPGFIPSGKRVAGQVGLIDLLPTLLDLLNLPVPRQAQGRSFASAVLHDADVPAGALFSELGDDLRAVRYPGYKVIWKPGADASTAAYYDLQNDSGETRPQSAAGGRADAAVTALRQHDLETLAVRNQLAAAGGHSPVIAAVPVDQQTLERLRALGYEAPHE